MCRQIELMCCLFCLFVAVQQLKDARGLALADILTEVHRYVMRMDFPPAMRIQLLDTLADIEYVSTEFCNLSSPRSCNHVGNDWQPERRKSYSWRRW
jgi:hypothetical protein